MAEAVTFVTDKQMNEMLGEFDQLMQEIAAGLLPAVDESNNGQILGVVNGEWTSVTVQTAEDMEI